MAQERSLKLLIDKTTHKVLFAEAGKAFVDFLFGLLAIPVGSVRKLLREQGMMGCIGKLYESVENLSDEYVQPHQEKAALLHPKILSSSNSNNLLFLPNDAVVFQNYETCTKKGYITEVCSQGDGKGGFVRDVVTYMITDDLVVTPMSTISGITLLNKFNIKDITSVEEKVVELGTKEGLKLLRASLTSKTALTDVFLKMDG